jgi:hypothetical protein
MAQDFASISMRNELEEVMKHITVKNVFEGTSARRLITAARHLQGGSEALRAVALTGSGKLVDRSNRYHGQSQESAKTCGRSISDMEKFE